MSIADDDAAYLQSQQQVSPPTGIAADDAAYLQSQQKPPDVTKLQGFNDEVLPGSENLPLKQEPDFLKKLDMINTGVHRGVTHFTHALLSKLPFGEGWQNAIKKADTDVEAEQQHNIQTYEGYYPQGGELGGEILATLPAGGLLGKGLQVAKSVSEVVPSVLSGITKYGLSGAVGVDTMAAIESQRYDPKNPGQLINSEAISNMTESPLSLGLAAGLPAAGAMVGAWADKAKALGKTSDILGQTAIPRNAATDSTKKTISQSVFSAIGALTPRGAQATELENIGTPVWNFISKVADVPSATNAADILQASGKTLQSTLKEVKKGVADAWNQPFKTKPVEDTASVISDANEALKIIKDVSPAIPSAGLYKTLIEKTLKKVDSSDSALFDSAGNKIASNKKLTIEDVKNIQSNIGSAISKVKKEAGSNDIVDELSTLREKLYNNMSSNLTHAEQIAFNTARTQSKLFYELKSNTSLIEEAITSERQSRNLIRKLISPAESVDKQQILDKMTQAGQQQVAATKLAQEWRLSNKSTGFDIDGFVTRVQNNSALSSMMGSETFKALNGLNTYLKSVSQGSKSNPWKAAAVATAIGVPAALSGVGPLAGAAVVVSLGAATYVANHPHLKNLFYGISKKLPESTKNLVQKAIGNNLSRAGYFIGTDGVLKHKDENKDKK